MANPHEYSMPTFPFQKRNLICQSETTTGALNTPWSSNSYRCITYFQSCMPVSQYFTMLNDFGCAFGFFSIPLACFSLLCMCNVCPASTAASCFFPAVKAEWIKHLHSSAGFSSLYLLQCYFTKWITFLKVDTFSKFHDILHTQTQVWWKCVCFIKLRHGRCNMAL